VNPILLDCSKLHKVRGISLASTARGWPDDDSAKAADAAVLNFLEMGGRAAATHQRPSYGLARAAQSIVVRPAVTAADSRAVELGSHLGAPILYPQARR